MTRLHPVFNVAKLIPAPSDPISGRLPQPPPPPEVVNGEEAWIVKEIFDSKMINRKFRYLVKWEGFGIEHLGRLETMFMIRNSFWNLIGNTLELPAKSELLTSTLSLSVPFHLSCQVVTPLKGG